jgi:hypothetical protein
MIHFGDSSPGPTIQVSLPGGSWASLLRAEIPRATSAPLISFGFSLVVEFRAVLSS